MELITKAPKGTVDIIPGESEKWSLVEAVMTDEAELNGFSEIRTPVFEHTELFLRSVGDTTDVVEKQMYTFEDKGGRSITLRPEGTAGAVRAMLENGLYNGGYPVKLYYKISCYRYEKPQAGRLRELHQFGVEMFGTAEPRRTHRSSLWPCPFSIVSALPMTLRSPSTPSAAPPAAQSTERR